MEKTIGVSEARQHLMKWTRHISDNMDRLVLTNKGRAETVLLSLTEYRSLVAAAQLAMHPEILAEARKGFAELAEGKGVSLEEAFRPVPRIGEAPFEPGMQDANIAGRTDDKALRGREAAAGLGRFAAERVSQAAFSGQRSKVRQVKKERATDTEKMAARS
ncbi:MAG TPA: type II toxin-antitoxin system Phd/YefM family antitoxin [Acidobacteriaceae bacterium]|nr:type II toxin-antitoxin system Phd/YefM family antitoxin [Acidobacteriaceae bacterium]